MTRNRFYAISLVSGLVGLVLAGTPALAQVPGGASGTIQGIVAHQSTGAPVSDVRVAVDGRGLKSTLVAFTDSSGRFAFRDVPAGSVVVRAQREGYFAPAVDGAHPNVASANAIVTSGPAASVRLSMIPASSISGVVRHRDGAPMTNFGVLLLRQGYEDGLAVLQTVTKRTTDDRGMYRLFGLAPGEYYVAAIPQPASGLEVPTLYPTAMALRGGEEVVGIDLEVQDVPVRKVSGRLVVPGNSRNLAAIVTLTDRNGVVFPGTQGFKSVSVNPVDGSFAMPGIPPGSYSLWARVGGRTSGRTDIEVRGTDLDNVSIAIQESAIVTGQTFVDGRPLAANVRLTLERVGLRGDPLLLLGRHTSKAAPDGSFTFPPVFEGHYRIRPEINVLESRAAAALPADAYIADIRQGGGSVYDSGILIAGGSSLPIEVLIRTDGGRIDGTVPMANITVALTPLQHRRQNLSLYKTVRSDSQGRFTMTGIAPGPYRLFAWENAPRGAFQNPEFLRQYETRGTFATVAPSGRVEVEMDLIR